MLCGCRQAQRALSRLLDACRGVTQSLQCRMGGFGTTATTVHLALAVPRHRLSPLAPCWAAHQSCRGCHDAACRHAVGTATNKVYLVEEVDSLSGHANVGSPAGPQLQTLIESCTKKGSLQLERTCLMMALIAHYKRCVLLRLQ